MTGYAHISEHSFLRVIYVYLPLVPLVRRVRRANKCWVPNTRLLAPPHH